MKQKIKRILAVICALVLVVNIFQGKSFESRGEGEYTEYTFVDFGISAQEIKGQQQVYSEDVPYTNGLDKVAISGEITFSEGSSVGSENIQIGNLCTIGPNSQNEKQFGVWNPQGSGWFGFSNEYSSSLIQNKLSIKLMFDKSGNDYTMKIEVNEEDLGTVTLTGGVALLTWDALMFNVGAGKTIVLGEKAVEYTEYTFADFGIEDQEITGKAVYSEDVPYNTGTGLDKVAIKGKITFPKGSALGSENIQIGNLCVVGVDANAGNRIGVWNIQGSSYFGFSNEIAKTLTGNAIELKLSFLKVGKNYEMKIEVDGEDVGAATLTNGVALLTWDALMFNAGAGKTIVLGEASKEPEEPENPENPVEFTEYTFADFKLSDQDITGKSVFSEDVPYNTKNGLDGIAIKGKITFPEGSALSSENIQIGDMCIIGVDGGNKIGVWNIKGKSYYGWSEETTKTLTGNAIELKLSFSKVDKDYVMKIAVDGEDLGEVFLSNGARLLTWDALMFNAGAGKTIVLGEGSPKLIEYTFADFGISDQDTTGNQISSDTIPYGTSLDKVAITGEITFPEGSAVGSENIQIGNLCMIGPATEKAFGVWNAQDGGWFGFSHDFSGSIIQNKLSVKLSFVELGNDYQMKIEVNGEDLGTVLLTNGVKLLTEHSLVVNAGAGKTVVLGEGSKETIEFKEYTFADFGIKDKVYKAGAVTGNAPSKVKSLDNIAITGYVAFSDSNSCIRIGGSDEEGYNTPISLFNSDGTLWSWDEMGTEEHVQIGAIETDKAVKVRVTFEYIKKDVKVTFYLNDAKAAEHIYKGYASKLGTKMLLWARGSALAVGKDTEIPKEEPIEFKEYTFADFGIKDKLYKTGIVTGNAPSKVKSLDKTAITGYVAFSDSNSCVRIGGNDEEGYNTPINLFNNNGTLWSWDEMGTEEHVQIGVIETNKAVKIRMTFEYIEDDVKVTFYLNDVKATDHLYKGYASKLGTKILLWARGKALAVGKNSKIPEEQPIEQKTPQELGYSQVRLPDFEMPDGVYSPEHKNGNHHFDVCDKDTLTNTYLDVNLKFEKPDSISRENSFRYASKDGWAGIQIGVEENQLVIQDALTGVGVTYTLKDLGLKSFDKTFNLKLGVKIGDANAEGKCDVTYDLWINDTRVEAEVPMEGVSGIGNGLGIYTPSGTIEITSPLSIYGSDGEGSKEELPVAFREVTFLSFGIADGTYTYNDGGLCTYGEYALSLDKTIFSADVFFSAEKGGDFRYGGKANEWCGLQFYNMPDGKLYMKGVEGDTGTYVFKSFVAGTELTDNKFNLKLSTEFVDSDGDGRKDDVKLGVWFNNALYDNAYIYLKDYAQYLGTYTGVYVDQGTGYITINSDTAVDLGIDYTLFGYTKNNWREEIGIKK